MTPFKTPKRKPISAFLALALCASLASAQEASDSQDDANREHLDLMRQEVQALRSGQSAIRYDIRQLNEALRNLVLALETAELGEGGPSADIHLDVAGKPFLGKVDAPITIFEVSDFE